MAAENGDGPSKPSELESKIIRQIEYYFGDMNLPRDKFMQEKMKENDGWVSMDVLLTFNRLKKMSDDKEFICKALKKSSSGLMEVKDDWSQIRRSPDKPLPDNTKERKDDIQRRTIYAKGFPADSTLDELQAFFESHGAVDTVFMRRERPVKPGSGESKEKEGGAFKGSVFVVFHNDEEIKTFLGLDGLKYKDTELIKSTKEDWMKRKQEESKQKRKGNVDQEQKEKAEKRKEEDEKKVEDQMTKGAVLFVKGVAPGTTMEEIKNFFLDFGTVAWVEFAAGDDKALVRFQEAVAQACMEKALAAGDGKIKLKEAELESRVLEGEEEKEYWRKFFRELSERKQKYKQKQGQNRKRKFGGRGGGGRHNRNAESASNDGSAAKKART